MHDEQLQEYSLCQFKMHVIYAKIMYMILCR